MPNPRDETKPEQRKPKEARSIPRHLAAADFDELEQVAYSVSFTPQIFASAYTVISELARRLPQTEFRPKRILEVGPGPGTAILAWREVHKRDLERVEEYIVVTPLHKVAKTLLEPNASELPSIKIRSVLPSSLEPEWNNFDVVISTHGLSDIEAPKGLTIARDVLVRDLWERVSPHGGVLILLERGTPNGFETIGRAREVILRTIRDEPIVVEDETAASIRRDLEALIDRMYGSNSIEEGIKEMQQREIQEALDGKVRKTEDDILGAKVVEFEVQETITQEQMIEHLREINELTDPAEIVKRVETLGTSPIRMARALRVLVKEETELAIEMIRTHSAPLPKQKKRTRAEQDEIDALEEAQAERIKKLNRLQDYAQLKIKEKKEEEEERRILFEKQNAPAVTTGGDTFFTPSNNIPHSDPVYSENGDFAVPPPLTPSSVSLYVSPSDTLSLIPAPPRKGHVIAPCPHDAGCPMYSAAPVPRGLIRFYKRPELAKGERPKAKVRREISLEREKIGIQGSGTRKWWCHFSQKLQDPQLYDKSPESVSEDGTELAKYSYVIIRKGVGRPKENPLCKRTLEEPDIRQELVLRDRDRQQAAYWWPRVIAAPIKNAGHILIDVCSPLSVREPQEPSLERLTITKAQGKQVYYDARKAQWGDLWAFGSRKPGIKREVVFKEDMARGHVGMRRKGDVEEQVRMEDEDALMNDEDTNAWAMRKLRRMEKVRKREERKEQKRVLRRLREQDRED